MVGFYIGNILGLVLRGPELVKCFLATDFHCFYPRGINVHKEVVEPLMMNLFTVDGDI